MRTTLIVFFVILLIGCKLQKEDTSKAEIPTINLEKEYPIKRIDIHEIADVEYIPLETTDKSLLGNAAFSAISENYIVIGDMKYFQILLFNRQGKYLRTIGKKGQGPGEYTNFEAFDVDFEKEEVYLYSLGLDQRMWIYSLNGKFKREFKYKYDDNNKKLDLKVLHSYDKDYLITYNDKYWPSPYPEYRREADKTPYYLINKENGAMKIAHKKLVVPNPVPPYLDKMAKGSSGHYNWTVGYTIHYMVQNGSEFLLVDNGLDTLYTFEKHALKPAMLRTPNTATMKTKRFISPCALTDRFFIYRRVILENDLHEQENIYYDKRKFPAYILDRKNKDIYQFEVYDSNISQELNLDSKLLTGFPGNGSFYSSTQRNQVVSLYYLHQLKNKIDINKTKGRFYNVYSKTKEDDNPIIVIYNFK